MNDQLPSTLHARLPLVRKPGQYVGLEHNATSAALQENGLNICLIFPDLYEIGMSHQGLQILYHVLNRLENVCAHRAYAPDTDMEALLRSQGLPLFSLEAGAPLSRYDLLGITLPYELCYTNILTILDLAGLPLRASERDACHPLVLGGGSCAFNPEPVADFFDAILLGDGEEAIVHIASLLRIAKENNEKRAITLEKLAGVEGVYVPAFFRPLYHRGRFQAMEALLPGHGPVRRAILSELDSGALLRRPLVPVVKPVHDRLAMEIARGCTRGCRFCQAGIIYRPVRERSMEDILAWAEEGIQSSGFEEMALLSLSTGDYSCLDPLVLELMNRFSRRRVSLSMPSMRVGTLSPAIMEQIRRVRKTGFTLAPEAGSERLRQVINKGISEEDLLATCRDAFSLGWNLLKFYFMIGLPTETEADVEAVAGLARKARAQAGGKNVQINVGVGVFVPKAHTPFQWAAQLDLDEANRRLELLKRLLPPRGFKLKWQDPEQSFLEGVFSRGDRRLSGLIEEAWRRGARLDSWGEHFQPERWRHAARSCGLDLDDYLRQRTDTEGLPWDHLDCGVSRNFLALERERALRQQYTPDCRVHGCQGCGICDFERIRPVLQPSPVYKATNAMPSDTAPEQARTSYRIHYSRLAESRLLGHLELLQLIFRALRRAGAPLSYSQGFNPTPRVSFSQALPVGMESRAEFFDMELLHPLENGKALLERLNRELPPGLRAHAIGPAPRKQPACVRASYEIRLSADADGPGNPVAPAALAAQAAAFLACGSFPISRIRKNRQTSFDMRPLVASLQPQQDHLHLELLHRQGLPGVNPREVLEHVFGLGREEALAARIVKTAVVDLPAPA